MAHRTPTIEVVVRDEVTRALERALAHTRDAGGGKFGDGFKGLENTIQSVARGISREFGTLVRITAGGLLGAGFVAGIGRTTTALSNVARAAQQHRYLAEQIGLTNTQLSNLVGRGRALGMSSAQTTAGLSSLSNNLRDLKVLGENSGAYKSLVETGGASGQRFADELIAAVRGPGGYEAAIRLFSTRMAGMNSDAQRKLSEIFGLGSIGFRDLNSIGLADLPKSLELAEPAARALTRATAEWDISWQNIKVTIGGAFLAPMEQLARTLDQFLQGPGRKVVEEFASWVKTIKIPWDAIGRALASAADLLGVAFIWVLKAIKDVDPLVQRIGGWTPLLITAGALLAAGQVNKVTWSLMAIGGALELIGQNDFIIAALATAANAAKAAAPSGVSSMTGGGGPKSQFGSPYSSNIEDRRGQPPLQVPPNAGRRSGYNLLGGGGGDTDVEDEDALSGQVRNTTREVLRLANFVTGSGGDADLGASAPSGQIRIPSGRTQPGGRSTAPSAPGGRPPARGPTSPPATPSTPPTPPSAPATPPAGPTAPAGPPSVPSGPGGPSTPPAPAPQPAPPTGGGASKGVMVFAHGIISLYRKYGGSIEQVEADARRLAKARGYSGVVFVYGTPAQQTAQIRELVKAGGVAAIVGFSGGAGPARTVGNETGIPTTTYGAPKVPGDQTVPGVKHMPQTAALADAAERAAAAGQPQQATAQPQPPSTPGGPTILPQVTVTAPPVGTGRVQQVQRKVAGIRRMDIDPRLQAALDYAAGVAGVTVRVTSGGQDPHGAHTGSHRHDYGKAADLDLVDENGNILRRGDPRRLAFLKAAASVGAGGIGTSYMNDPGKLKMHIGITGSRSIVGEGLGSYAGTPDEKRAVAEGLAIFYADREAAKRKLAGLAAPAPLAPSPIVWSNSDEIDRLKREQELKDQFPLGGYTPIPGKPGKVSLKINLRGPRGVKVAGEGTGAVGAATIDRSDPSGGIEGFSPA